MFSAPTKLNRAYPDPASGMYYELRGDGTTPQNSTIINKFYYENYEKRDGEWRGAGKPVWFKLHMQQHHDNGAPKQPVT